MTCHITHLTPPNTTQTGVIKSPKLLVFRCTKLKVNQSAESGKPAKYQRTGCAMFVNFLFLTESDSIISLTGPSLASLHCHNTGYPGYLGGLFTAVPSQFHFLREIQQGGSSASSTATLPTMTGRYQTINTLMMMIII